ncbi:MAG: hypothetical protein KA586_02185 [Candidatus Promineofilum sp.]|nr:hypothetical protein [Promineifilum sp.]
MLPVDIQAELIRSFQDEKRQQYEQMRQQMVAAGLKPGRWRWRAGALLIAAGRGLQRMAEPAVEPDERHLGWEK